MEPLDSIGELRFQENLPHGLLLEDIPLSGCRKVALRLEDGSISHAARGGQPLLEPHSVRGGSSQNGDVPGDTVSLKETQLQGQNKKRAEALFVVSYRVVL